MASCPQGYDEERFETTISQNFHCLICFNVLRNPVLCTRNEHHFCRACITKFLDTSQRCPTCADELTLESLTEPPRFVKNYLNELKVRCKYVNRGCREIVQLQHLDSHEATCGFTPVVCTNQGCGVTVNKRDQIHHESELCEFRKLKCHSCGEMTKTMTDIEKRIANVEKKIRKVEAIETKMTNMEKSMAEIKTNMVEMKTNMEETNTKMEERRTVMEGKLEAVNDEVRGLKAALLEGFNEMKAVLVKMEDMKEVNTRKVRGGPSGDKEKENIILAGGLSTGSVEIFNWRRKLWSPLQSLPNKRYGTTSFVYNNCLIIVGGFVHDYFDTMIRMKIDPNPDLSAHWSECPFKLRNKLAHHSSVLYNDQLIVTGGENRNATSDCIDEVQLVPPYTVKTLSRMPEPRQYHSSEIVDDNLFIVGGSTTGNRRNNLSSVVLYDIKKNECKQLAPLPYEVSDMATVRWADNIVVIGGVDKHGMAIDRVIIYNVKTERHRMLPSMIYKRNGCTAVVIRKNIVVLGGSSNKGNPESVEGFNFDRNTWEELPKMSEQRYLPTAVAV